jgi:hypothetical protein
LPSTGAAWVQLATASELQAAQASLPAAAARSASRRIAERTRQRHAAIHQRLAEGQTLSVIAAELGLAATPSAERWIASCRRELLDRTLVWNQQHLLIVMREYEDFYNTHRPHRTLNKPRRSARCPTASPTWIISGSSGVTAPGA